MGKRGKALVLGLMVVSEENTLKMADHREIGDLATQSLGDTFGMGTENRQLFNRLSGKVRDFTRRIEGRSRA